MTDTEGGRALGRMLTTIKRAAVATTMLLAEAGGTCCTTLTAFTGTTTAPEEDKKKKDGPPLVRDHIDEPGGNKEETYTVYLHLPSVRDAELSASLGLPGAFRVTAVTTTRRELHIPQGKVIKRM